MKPVSYVKLQQRYSNKFIARRDGRILASAKTMSQLFAELSKKNIPYTRQIIIGHVPSPLR